MGEAAFQKTMKNIHERETGGISLKRRRQDSPEKKQHVIEDSTSQLGIRLRSISSYQGVKTLEGKGTGGVLPTRVYVWHGDKINHMKITQSGKAVT